MLEKKKGPLFSGRSWAEYLKMFNLTTHELKKMNILDCAAGASSFTAHMGKKGYHITAVDLLYDQNPDLLRAKCREHLQILVNALQPLKNEFVWTYFRDLDHLLEHRMLSCQEFSRDYAENPERYVPADLTSLPFDDNEFKLVLSSHLFFIYDHRLDLEFHLQALKEMIRVCKNEVRVYPLVKHHQKKSSLLKPVRDELSNNAEVDLVKVDYQFRQGGNEMLVIKNNIRD